MSFQPWGNPDPQSIFGLNSAMVYGENIQVAVGLNNQIALGNNLQICVNPLVLFDLLSVPGTSALSALWGSGLGGNMQFTIGSSTNVVWGRQYAFNLGPEQISVNSDPKKPLHYVLTGLVGAVAVVYAIAYGATTDEDGRANVVIVCQVLMNVLLAVLMGAALTLWQADEKTSETLKALFASPPPEHPNTWWQNLLTAVGALAVLVPLIILEPVMLSQEEGHFQGETQSQ